MTLCVNERLHIRHFTLDDAPFILRLLNDPSFITNITDKGVRSLDAARDYLRDGPIASYRKHGFGLNAVELRHDSTPIGMCGMLKRDDLPHPDIGYALLPEFCGRGYALEAAQCVFTHHRKQHPNDPICAIVKPGNARSIHLLEKLGLRAVGTYRMVPEPAELLLFRADPPPRADGLEDSKEHP